MTEDLDFLGLFDRVQAKLTSNFVKAFKHEALSGYDKLDTSCLDVFLLVWLGVLESSWMMMIEGKILLLFSV